MIRTTHLKAPGRFVVGWMAVSLAFALTASARGAADMLPSWNDTAPKRAIVSFVERVTRDGSPDFVPVPERIAVFDNDGTLWCEQPVYFQMAFALDQIKAMAGAHQEWKSTEPYKSVLNGDMGGLAASGEKGLLQLVAATHAGMTTDEFDAAAREWLRTARHPRWHRPYAECVYRPMLELLAYLRANGFKTFIVSGGGVEFLRAFAEEAYGIPPEQVVGSSGGTRFEDRDGKPVLVKLPKLEFVDDGPGKPSGIERAIGRRPVLAFGNSDGDRQMLEWTAGSPGPRLAALVHHDDAGREYAYDRQSKVGRLDKALDEAAARHWTVVSMKDDWNTLFPPAANPQPATP